MVGDVNTFLHGTPGGQDLLGPKYGVDGYRTSVRRSPLSKGDCPGRPALDPVGMREASNETQVYVLGGVSPLIHTVSSWLADERPMNMTGHNGQN